jgi:acyl carrier protein
MELEREIRAFVVENFLFGDDKGLNTSQSLLDAGIVDSTGVLELVTFLEKTYNIHVADQEFVPENLDSIGRIVGFVRGKLAGQNAA